MFQCIRHTCQTNIKVSEIHGPPHPTHLSQKYENSPKARPTIPSQSCPSSVARRMWPRSPAVREHRNKSMLRAKTFFHRVHYRQPLECGRCLCHANHSNASTHTYTYILRQPPTAFSSNEVGLSKTSFCTDRMRTQQLANPNANTFRNKRTSCLEANIKEAKRL